MAGDTFNFSGNFNGSNINVKSTLDRVKQSIDAADKQDPAAKAELRDLVAQMQEALQRLPAEKQGEAVAVADSMHDLIGKATKDQPDIASVNISANSFKETAKGVAEVLPIAIQIVTVLRAFVGF